MPHMYSSIYPEIRKTLEDIYNICLISVWTSSRKGLEKEGEKLKNGNLDNEGKSYVNCIEYVLQIGCSVKSMFNFVRLLLKLWLPATILK